MAAVCFRAKLCGQVRGFFFATGRHFRIRGVSAGRRRWRAMDAGAVLFGVSYVSSAEALETAERCVPWLAEILSRKPEVRLRIL